MLFGKKNCTECGSNYDVVQPTCPTCGRRDENFETLGIPKYVVWMSWWKQLLLFVVGLIGLNILGIVAELLFYGILDPNSVEYLLTINTFRYVMAAGAMAFVVWKDWKYFKNSVNRWWTYLAGIGFAVALIMASIFVNTIINFIYPTETNANQTAVNSLVTTYPLLSLLILGILGPIVEEFTYRVGLFTLLRRINVWVAYIVSPIIFALIHFNFFAGTPEGYINELLNLPSYIIAGAALTVIYDQFGLSASTVAHCGNNLISILLTIVANLFRNGQPTSEIVSHIFRIHS